MDFLFKTRKLIVNRGCLVESFAVLKGLIKQE